MVIDHAEAAVRPTAGGRGRGAQDPQAGRSPARSGRLEPLSAGTTEHWVTTAVVISTADGRSAMGVFSPGIWKGDPRQDFYSYFYYPGAEATAKWSCRFGETEVRAGTVFNYSAAIAVGSVAEVTRALDAFIKRPAER